MGKNTDKLVVKIKYTRGFSSGREKLLLRGPDKTLNIGKGRLAEVGEGVSFMQDVFYQIRSFSEV